MREVCRCPYCGGDHPHVSRIEGSVKLCWCQWCYRVHEVELADVAAEQPVVPRVDPFALVPAT